MDDMDINIVSDLDVRLMALDRAIALAETGYGPDDVIESAIATHEFLIDGAVDEASHQQCDDEDARQAH